eukprot:jgi/Tetstr1/443287/TSEL_000258.t1
MLGNMPQGTVFQVRVSPSGGETEIERVEGVAAPALRTPGTFERRLLWAELAALIGLESAGWSVMGLSCCGQRELEVGGVGRCTGTYAVIDMINKAKIFSLYGTLLFIYLAQCYRVSMAWNSTLWPANKAHVSHWTLGASRGIFSETADTVMRAQRLNVVVTVVVLLVCLPPLTVNTVKDILLQTAKGNIQWEAGIGHTCGPGVTLCSIGWFSMGTVTWTSAWMMVTLTSMLRSVATVGARVIIMSWCVNVALVVVLTFLMFWISGVMPCKEWEEGAKEQAAKSGSASRRLFTPSGKHRKVPDQTAGLLGHSPVVDTGGWRQWVSKEALMFKVQELRIEPGVRYMRQTLLLLDIFTWATNVMFWQTSFYAMLAVWSCRVGVLAALLLGSGEQAADFNLLQRHRAEKVRLAEGAWVNMTSWQMRTLAETIRSSTALYVWLDHLSVPQQTHPELMNTLLSRMMAVYTAAGVTLSLRSCEREGSRYHQRGWTAQEYCTAPRMIVITQEDPADAEAALSAYFDEEEGTLRSVRQWWQTHARRCRPFWLHGGVGHISDAQLRAIMRKYEELESKVHTEDPADVLRALYPLMFHVPVENQDELVELVQQVNQRQGRDEPKLRWLKEGAGDGDSPRGSLDTETRVEPQTVLMHGSDALPEEVDPDSGINEQDLLNVPSPQLSID